MRLGLLALANFTVGFGAFVVVGVLPPLAAAFGVGAAEAGQVMSVYAIAYALASPVGVALTGRLDRRDVLGLGLALFGAGALVAALAPGFGVLLGARVVMAVGGGLVTPVAASVALGLALPAERGRALALVFGGLTLAQAVGVPAGAWVGYAFGWHAAFALAAALAAATLAASLRLPRGLQAPVTSLATLGAVLRAPALVAAVAFTAVFVGGLYVLYTYLAAFMEARLGLGRDGVSLLLLVYGAGAVIGNWAGGRLTDRVGPARTLTGLALAQLVVMPALTLLPLGPGAGGVAAVAVLLLAWSASSWSFMVPQQARLAALDPERAPVLFALNAAAIYLGAALGAAAGAAVLAGTGGTALLGPVGALVAAAGLASLPLASRLRRGVRSGRGA